MFDLFTPFSVGLVYLMYKSFYQITLHKPNTSRPANSEREGQFLPLPSVFHAFLIWYLVCKWKRENTASIRDYLYEVNLKLNNKRSKSDVMELVPVDILKEDTQFYDFIYESNNILGERQIINLVKIKAFCQDTTLLEFKQADMKHACLEFWKVPNNTRTAPKPKQPEEKMRELFSVSKPAWLSIPARELTKESLEKEITPYDWRCMLLECNMDRPSPLTFYLGIGRGHVYSWDQDRGKWYRCRNIELSPGTLVYAELVYELRGEGRSQVKIQQLHIIDAAFLGGKDIRGKHLKERLEMCHKFALALNKPSRTELLLIRVKELFSLAEMRALYSRLEEKVIKGHGGQVKLGFNLPGHDEKFFIPGGVLFLKTTQDPWQMALSRSSNKKYWFNRETKQSFYECPHNSNMDFVKSFERRLWWAWTPDVNLFPDPDSHSLTPAQVHRCNIDSLLHSQMNR
ncbi:hypothetical protein B566_EDAN017238 [Ephemera danica]|nr:hypothetical protein B566_EDAN017238 [Ephemera danica]